MLDGVLVVDKPEGPTSHDVVAVARRALNTRRIGHTGTLDPLATGVLALVVGQATRLSRFLTDADKGYDAVIGLGIATDTYDRAGTIVAREEAAAHAVTDAALEAGLERFRGRIVQAPPPFSAKKIGGVRAYALARASRTVTMPPVEVTVHRLELVSRDRTRVTLRLEVSAGFYVRALAHELGAALGCGAHLEGLRRYRSGTFTLNDAVGLDTLASDPHGAVSRLAPLERLLPEFPPVVLSASDAGRARHGHPVAHAAARHAGEFTRLLTPEGRLLGIARTGPGPVLQPIVVLN
jgi:tRNA pseudouridine55 synthase